MEFPIVDLESLDNFLLDSEEVILGKIKTSLDQKEEEETNQNLVTQETSDEVPMTGIVQRVYHSEKFYHFECAKPGTNSKEFLLAKQDLYNERQAELKKQIGSGDSDDSSYDYEGLMKGLNIEISDQQIEEIIQDTPDFKASLMGAETEEMARKSMEQIKKQIKMQTLLKKVMELPTSGYLMQMFQNGH